LAVLRIHSATNITALHTADVRLLQIAVGYEGEVRGSFC